MPLVSVQQYTLAQLDGLILPLNLGTLRAWITPPNPGDAAQASAYIWGSRGDEERLSVPRAEPGNLATGGDKQITHHLDVWLVWIAQTDVVDIDLRFSSIVDAVCSRLRNAPLVDGTQYVTDPVTEQVSQILTFAEQLSWEYAPVRAVADQRFLRFDAQITVEVVEVIQA